jgi:hypothetical protein
MNKALERVSDALAVGASAAQVQAIPANRLRRRRRPGPVRSAHGDPVINPARRATNEQRLAVLPWLEKASALLLAVNKVLLEVLTRAENGRVDVAMAWAAVEMVAPREQVAAAQAVVEELTPDADGDDTGCEPTSPLVTAWSARSSNCWPRRCRWTAEVQATLVPPMWRPAVFANRRMPQGAVDPRRLRAAPARPAPRCVAPPRRVRPSIATLERPARPSARRR